MVYVALFSIGFGRRAYGLSFLRTDSITGLSSELCLLIGVTESFFFTLTAGLTSLSAGILILILLLYQMPGSCSWVPMPLAAVTIE